MGDVVAPSSHGKFSICEVIVKPMKTSDFNLTVLGNDQKQSNIKKPDFSEVAKNKAEKESVRLINGNEFSRMLIDTGVYGIEQAV